MPTMNPDIQQAFWQLADALAKSLRSGDSEDGTDAQWRVTALASRAWAVTHPDLPIVEDESGASKDTLLQLHVQPDPKSGLWFVIAQNKVVGPESHASPRALAVAKKDTPPGDDWDFDEIAEAAANFFRQQKKDLVEKAAALMPDSDPGDLAMEENPPPGAAGPAASRRARLASLVYASKPVLLTQGDFDEFISLAGIQPNDVGVVKRELPRRLQAIANVLKSGTKAWRGHGYSFRAVDPTMTHWEASDGSPYNSSSLLGMLIHAMGRDVEVIESSGFVEDWIIDAPRDQGEFESS